MTMRVLAKVPQGVGLKSCAEVVGLAAETGEHHCLHETTAEIHSCCRCAIVFIEIGYEPIDGGVNAARYLGDLIAEG